MLQPTNAEKHVRCYAVKKYNTEHMFSARKVENMYCPYHDTHDFSGIVEKCYYCTTTDEEHTYLQKLAKQCEKVQNKRVFESTPHKAGSSSNTVFVDEVHPSSNVYIIDEEKGIHLFPDKHLPHRIELIPTHLSSHNFHLSDVKQAITTHSKDTEYIDEVLEAYLTYLGHTTVIQEKTKRSPPASSRTTYKIRQSKTRK